MVDTGMLGAEPVDSDALLLEQMRRGDTSAFERLFERHYAAVYRALFGLLGTREAAEDVAQETFLTLYHTPPRLEAGAALVAWLCRVALNRGRNAMRGERRASARAERLSTPTPQDGPEELAARREDRRHVREALARLPEKQATLLLLRHAGLSYAEVAQALDIAPGSVGTLLARAEKAFVASYDHVGDDDGPLLR
jgi:RNA polymerase sigma-70 factor, ECF subfamily